MRRRLSLSYDQLAEWLIRWRWAIVIALVAFALAWDVSYAGRQAIVRSQRDSCQRAQSDRRAEAEQAYSEYIDEGDPTALQTAASLNLHLDARHAVTWPEGSHRHPLGVSSFTCAHAFPAASPFEFGG